MKETTNVKDHYQNHLAGFYSWMVGDFRQKEQEFQDFLKSKVIAPPGAAVAIDLGAGHGIQSVALAHRGYKVTAIDFNKQLLEELQSNKGDLDIDIVEDDIRNIKNYAQLNPELVVCCGDTLSHLDDQTDINHFIRNCADTLVSNGTLIVSFRDYSRELLLTQRFIPVKSDEKRILTCILEYFPQKLQVTDLLYEKTGEGWVQKVSTYSKVRIITEEILNMLADGGFKVKFNEPLKGMQTVIAEKG